MTRFAQTTKPLVDELRPAAVQLSPALESLAVLAPQLKSLIVNVGPLTEASKAGRARRSSSFLDDSVPLLTRPTPYLGGVVPVIDYINSYRREIAGVLRQRDRRRAGHGPGAVGNKLLHYVRVSSPVNPETLTDYSHRLSSNRGNPYLVPSGYKQPARRTARLRQLSVHEQPSAGDRPYYSRLAGRRAERRLLHVGPQRPAVQGAAAARRSNHRTTTSIPPTTTNPMSMAGSACSTNQKEESVATTSRNCHGACRARRPRRPRTRPPPASTPTPPSLKFSPNKAGTGKAPWASVHPEVHRQRHQRKPHRAADRHQDQDLRHGLRREGVPDLQPGEDRRRPRATPAARRARWSRRGSITALLGPSTDTELPRGRPCRATRCCDVWNAGQGKVVFFFVDAGPDHLCAVAPSRRAASGRSRARSRPSEDARDGYADPGLRVVPDTGVEGSLTSETLPGRR